MILTTGWRKFNFEFDFDSRFIPFDWFDFERFIVIPKYATLNILKFKVGFEIHTFWNPGPERQLFPDLEMFTLSFPKTFFGNHKSKYFITLKKLFVMNYFPQNYQHGTKVIFALLWFMVVK